MEFRSSRECSVARGESEAAQAMAAKIGFISRGPIAADGAEVPRPRGRSSWPGLGVVLVLVPVLVSPTTRARGGWSKTARSTE